MNKNLNFSGSLLQWNTEDNTRKMPWKNETDPYKIWISEIILQQTRVEQGMPYYEKFIRTFPNVQSLAAAPENEVFKLWEGLGYYSRCRNLIASARYIKDNLKGQFPDTYEDILKLKGVGPYTAAAIASFAFGLPHAVLDGNVFRVLSRYFGIKLPVDSSAGKAFYAAKANELLPVNNPGTYNQAIMDFGAVICKPALPLCTQCPFQYSCVAYHTNSVSNLPVSEKKINRKNRYLHYLVVEYNGNFYVKKRSEKDIWQNLFEFLLIESDRILHKKDLENHSQFEKLFEGTEPEILHQTAVSKQILTHQVISGRFFLIKIRQPLSTDHNHLPVSAEDLQLLAFPKFITAFLKDKNVSLNLF